MKHKRPRVLILYNIPREKGDQSAGPVLLESDAGVLDEVQAVDAALERLGVVRRIAGIRNLTDLPPVLATSTEDVVFNLVEGFHSFPIEANFIPAICNAYGKECTGNTTSCLLITLDKWQTKGVLGASNLRCAPGVLIPRGQTVRRSKLPAGPYIIKPVATDASEGIDSGSFVREAGPAMRKAVKRVHDGFNQAALIEQYVGNRELNVSIIQKGNQVDVMAIAEIDFKAFSDDKPRIVDYSAKWLPDTFEYLNTPRILPAPIPEQVADEVRRCALETWNALGCRDYARVDFRLDDEDLPTILEVNANPDISPEGGFAAGLEFAGMSYDQFVDLMISNAFERLRARQEPVKAASPNGKAAVPAIPIRWSRPDDREAIVTVLKETDAFRADEVDVALEVLDDALAHGESGHYQSHVAEDGDGHVIGWVCFGPTPCTLGTFDIYWIAVSPNRQAKGIGTALMHHAESLIRQRGGRVAVVETSGRPSYLSSRLFYCAKGYQEKARLRDFYAPDDDKVIYTKELGEQERAGAANPEARTPKTVSSR